MLQPLCARYSGQNPLGTQPSRTQRQNVQDPHLQLATLTLALPSKVSDFKFDNNSNPGPDGTSESAKKKHLQFANNGEVSHILTAHHTAIHL